MSPSDSAAERYSPTAIVLHWVIAVAVIVQIGWGWWMQGIPKQPVGPRVDAFNMHKSIGLTILALMCVRVLWRWRHAAPPLPPMPRWQSGLAHATHVTLYAALFVMPIAGYLGSVFSGYPVKYFGMVLPVWGAANSALKDFMSALHYVTSWILVGAIALHIAGALKHALINRDGLVARMGLGSAPHREAMPARTSARTPSA
jgi:cytochrome b561